MTMQRRAGLGRSAVGAMAVTITLTGFARADPPTWAYTLLDASQATQPDGVVLFAAPPKALGDHASIDLEMVWVVPKPDATAGNAVISHVTMPLEFACSTRMVTQLRPTIYDAAGQVVAIDQGDRWPQTGQVPAPEPGVVEPAFEAYRLACGQRVVTKTFPSLAAVLAFAHNAVNAPLLAPP